MACHHLPARQPARCRPVSRTPAFRVGQHFQLLCHLRILRIGGNQKRLPSCLPSKTFQMHVINPTLYGTEAPAPAYERDRLPFFRWAWQVDLFSQRLCVAAYACCLNENIPLSNCQLLFFSSAVSFRGLRPPASRPRARAAVGVSPAFACRLCLLAASRVIPLPLPPS